MTHVETYLKMIDKITQAARTPAYDWISNLPLYKCLECGKETIFKEICADCACKDDEVENDKIT